MIDWNKHVNSVLDEISLYSEMSSKGYIPYDAVFMNQLYKDLHHCQFMAGIKRKRRK